MLTGPGFLLWSFNEVRASHVKVHDVVCPRNLVFRGFQSPQEVYWRMNAGELDDFGWVRLGPAFAAQPEKRMVPIESGRPRIRISEDVIALSWSRFGFVYSYFVAFYYRFVDGSMVLIFLSLACYKCTVHIDRLD